MESAKAKKAAPSPRTPHLARADHTHRTRWQALRGRLRSLGCGQFPAKQALRSLSRCTHPLRGQIFQSKKPDARPSPYLPAYRRRGALLSDIGRSPPTHQTNQSRTVQRGISSFSAICLVLIPCARNSLAVARPCSLACLRAWPLAMPAIA